MGLSMNEELITEQLCLSEFYEIPNISYCVLLQLIKDIDLIMYSRYTNSTFDKYGIQATDKWILFLDSMFMQLNGFMYNEIQQDVLYMLNKAYINLEMISKACKGCKNKIIDSMGNLIPTETTIGTTYTFSYCCEKSQGYRVYTLKTFDIDQFVQLQSNFNSYILGQVTNIQLIQVLTNIKNNALNIVSSETSIGDIYDRRTR